MKKILLSLFTFFCVLATANAETYTHTFKNGELTTTGGAVTLSDIEWNATDATLIEWNATKGIQFGSKATPNTAYTLSTSGFAAYKIKSVTVNSSIAASGDATMKITVGAQTSDAYELTTSNAAYTFDCDDTNGNITINWTATQRAYYVKSITVEYELPTDMVEIEKPTFKTPEGVYENKVTVTAETADQALVLYYTLDGTDPSYEDFQSETGTTKCSKYYVMYPELTESATIKAMAVKVDGETVYKSDIVEAKYIVSPTKPYVPATTIASGNRYAFVANDNVADFLFGAANGNLQGREVSGKYDKYIETVEYNAFTFTSTNGGYTIQDAEGRYMYLEGNDGKVSFAAEKPAAGAVWSVSIDNGQATIKNGNSTLYYSADNNIFGCYAEKAGDMVLPSLYMVREYPKATITPENGSYVQGLKEFTITCEEGIAVSSDFSLKAQSGQREDRTYEIDKTYTCTRVDANTLKFTINDELVSVLQCLQCLHDTVNDLQLVEGQVGDDLLDAVVDVVRKTASAEVHGSVGHTDQVGLRTISEEGDVLLLFLPQHLLHALWAGVVLKQFDEFRLRIAEITLVFPQSVVSINENGVEFTSESFHYSTFVLSTCACSTALGAVSITGLIVLMMTSSYGLSYLSVSTVAILSMISSPLITSPKIE